MNFSTQKRRRTPTVIIISLIDVLLVVLIFLMVSTTFKKEQVTLKLTLPQSKTAQAGAGKDAKPMMIAVSSNFPYFYVDNKAVTYDHLQSDLAAAVKKDPELKVAIKVDKAAPMGEFVRVIDATKLANINGNAINLIVDKPQK